MASEEKSEGVVQGSGVVSFTQPTWRILNHRPSAVGEDGGAYGQGERGADPDRPGAEPDSEASHEAMVDIIDVWSPPELVPAAGRLARLLDVDMDEQHLSLVYFVPYQHDTTWVHTFARLDIPRRFDREKSYLPLALLVDGGKQATSAVRSRQRDYPEHKLIEYLVAGTPGASVGDFPYRDGDPMVVVTFSQPGRGGENDFGNPEYLGPWLLMASPNPAYVNSTPENTEGQDCGGAMTVAAMNGVMGVSRAVLESMAASVIGSREAELLEFRIVVASLSFGLASASHWIRELGDEDGLEIHALVDWEGPADSLDITLASQCTAPFGKPGGSDYRFWRYDRSFRPSYRTWADWFGGDWISSGRYPDLFFFRPPKVVLEQLDGTEESLLQGEPIGSDAAKIWYVGNFYGEGHWDAGMKRELWAYWDEREPVEHLAYLDCPYIRIQADNDHIQPDWLSQRHAVKAINAALESGQQVFLAGEKYIMDWRLEPANPTLMRRGLDEFDETGWPRWLVAPSKGWEGIKSFVVLDLVRWAMDQSF